MFKINNNNTRSTLDRSSVSIIEALLDHAWSEL